MRAVLYVIVLSSCAITIQGFSSSRLGAASPQLYGNGVRNGLLSFPSSSGSVHPSRLVVENMPSFYLNRAEQPALEAKGQSESQSKRFFFGISKKITSVLVGRLGLAVTALAMFHACSVLPAHAAPAASAATEHLHTGQKVANFFRTFGIPDWSVLAIISALPVVELRGAIPVGVWMGLPITSVLPICVLGNMVPIVPILLLLRNDVLKRWMKPILTRAEKKTSELGIGSLTKQWTSLAAFVGIPLPGTGAWTGAMGAFLLNMPFWVALSSIFAGVVSAGLIMTAITLAGRIGGIAALSVLLIFAGVELTKKNADPKAE